MNPGPGFSEHDGTMVMHGRSGNIILPPHRAEMTIVRNSKCGFLHLGRWNQKGARNMSCSHSGKGMLSPVGKLLNAERRPACPGESKKT